MLNSHTELVSFVLDKAFATQLMDNCVSPRVSCIHLLHKMKHSLSVNGVFSVPSAAQMGVREGSFLAGELFIFVEPLSHTLCNCLSGLRPPFPVCTSVEVLAHLDNVTVLITHEHIV